MKNVYMAQMSLELPGSNYYYYPYSVGVVWAYATTQPGIVENYQLGGLYSVKEPIEQLVDRMVDPAVVGLSSYVWNVAYNEALSKEIKSRYPECKLIIGGAETPNKSENFFADKPYIDYLIHQEGEISFTGLLQSFVGLKDEETVPGISINRNGKTLMTGPSQRIMDLSQVPSPYTMGLFDHLDEMYPGKIWNAVIETNRGCPFMCTFCDWGGTTFSKVKKFGLERIQEELDWMGRNKIEMLTNTDANFGIFKDRDMEITDMLIATKKKYGFPVLFDTNWSKNATVQLVDMAVKLMESDMMRRFTMALQSTNQDVLKNIKRVNLKEEAMTKVAETAFANDMSVNTELIIGLPGETWESWTQGLCDLLSRDIIVEAYPVTILQNSEMNEPGYKEKHGITQVTLKSYFSNIVDEYQETLTGTKDLPEEQMKKLWLWTWYTSMMDANGFTQIVTRYLNKRHGMQFEKFYERLLDWGLQTESCAAHKWLKKWQGYGEKLEFNMFLAGLTYAPVLEDLGVTNRSQTFQDIMTVAREFAPDDPLLQDVMIMQERQQTIFAHDPTTKITLGANVFEYSLGKEPLKIQPTRYTLYRAYPPKGTDPTWVVWMNSTRKNKKWQAKVSYETEKKLDLFLEKG
jgi:putative methyltransferase